MIMTRIEVDFNTLTSAPVGLVKYLQEQGQPPLREGERVRLYDADGLEVEATIVPFTKATGERVWLAEPDAATWRDTLPQDNPSQDNPSQDNPLPPADQEEAPSRSS